MGKKLIIPENQQTDEYKQAYEEYKALEQLAISKTKKSNNFRVDALRALWEIDTRKLWTVEFEFRREWLGDLYEQGVPYATETGFHYKMEAIKIALELNGGDFDNAVRVAALHEGSLKSLKWNNDILISKTGRGTESVIEVTVTDNNKELARDPVAYMERIAEQGDSKKSNQMVRDDSSNKTDMYCSSATKVMDSPVEYDDVMVATEIVYNGTPYSVLVQFDKGLPVKAREKFVQRHKQSFEW